MRIPSGVIQDYREDALPSYGVEIVRSSSASTMSTSLPEILGQLFGQDPKKAYKNLSATEAERQSAMGRLSEARRVALSQRMEHLAMTRAEALLAQAE